jgi:hypothetical protein
MTMMMVMMTMMKEGKEEEDGREGEDPEAETVGVGEEGEKEGRLTLNLKSVKA